MHTTEQEFKIYCCIPVRSFSDYLHSKYYMQMGVELHIDNSFVAWFWKFLVLTSSPKMECCKSGPWYEIIEKLWPSLYTDMALYFYFLAFTSQWRLGGEWKGKSITRTRCNLLR